MILEFFILDFFDFLQKLTPKIDKVCCQYVAKLSNKKPQQSVK